MENIEEVYGANFLSEENLLKDTEEKLKVYFNKINILGTIDIRIKSLENRIKELEEDLKKTRIEIPIESKSPSFDERVQTSSDGISYAERKMISITSKMEQMLEKYRIELIDLKDERYRIKTDNEIIETNINQLKEQYVKIIKMLYGEDRSEEYVAQKLNLDRSNINRRKYIILKNVEHWLFLGKCK